MQVGAQVKTDPSFITRQSRTDREKSTSFVILSYSLSGTGVAFILTPRFRSDGAQTRRTITTENVARERTRNGLELITLPF